MVTIDQHFDRDRDYRAEDVDQRLAVAITWRDYDRELQHEILNRLADAATEVFPKGTPVHVRGAAYHVGPMASGITCQMLFTAVENVQPFIDTAASWIEVGAFAILVLRYTREALRKRIERTGPQIDSAMPSGPYLRNDAIVLSQPLIRGLCEYHFHEMYGDSGRQPTVDVTSRPPYSGIWAGRPAESMVYVVRFWTGQTSYVYVIDGRGKPIEHFSIRGGRLASLTLPGWFGNPW